MKRFILLLLITASIAACGDANKGDSNETEITSGADTTKTITEGNTDATMGQEIHRDSLETASDSTGNIPQ